MDKLYSANYKNLIIRDRFFLIIDNKDNRRFCTINMKKAKLGKREIKLDFFENKNLNTFWDIDGDKYTQITHKEYFNENIGEHEKDDVEYNEKINIKTNKEIYSDVVYSEIFCRRYSGK